MDVSTAIDIKRRKLALELSKKNQNKQVIRRLKESIRRHEKDMEKYNRWKKKRIMNGGQRW